MQVVGVGVMWLFLQGDLGILMFFCRGVWISDDCFQFGMFFGVFGYCQLMFQFVVFYVFFSYVFILISYGMGI